MSTKPQSSRSGSNASQKASTSAAPRSRASALDPRNSREDPTNRTAGRHVPKPQQVFRLRATRSVVKITSTAPAAGVYSAEINVLDARINIANVAQVKLLQEVRRVRRQLEEAQLGDVSGDIRILRQDINSFLENFRAPNSFVVCHRQAMEGIRTIKERKGIAFT